MNKELEISKTHLIEMIKKAEKCLVIILDHDRVKIDYLNMTYFELLGSFEMIKSDIYKQIKFD